MGWDPRDDLAYRVAVRSIRRHASSPVEILPIKDRALRDKGIYRRTYWVDESGQMYDDADGKPFSTQFSFARFAVPILEDYADTWVLFLDPDILVRSDIADLFALADDRYAVMCVKHDFSPPEGEKMDGVRQERYFRKGWSSAMLMNPAKCRSLDRYELNRSSGSRLHGFLWLQDDLIGEISPDWNYLVNWHRRTDIADPKLVHFTYGSPDMPGHESDDYAAEWRSYLKPDEQGDLT